MGEELIIRLPLPPREASPNARVHWAERYRVTSSMRLLASAAVFAQGRNGWRPGDSGPIAVEVRYYVPDRRRRDLDNLLASSKAFLDGLAAALGVDDSRFVITMSREVERGRAETVITVGP